jgi:protein-tyrosine phosphatase
VTVVSPSLPSRHLPLAGTYNVRDVGGYATACGGRTRWHTLIRADSLHRLTPESQETLLALGLRTVIDLRRPNETGEWPNVFAASPRVRYLNVDLVGGASLVPSERDDWQLDVVYCAILDRRDAALGEIFRTLAAPGAFPVAVHCTAGKDRTGLVVALALALAGVDSETIASDYALSSTFLVGPYLEEARARALASGLSWDRYQLRLACRQEFMRRTLDHLESSHGGAAAYLRAAGVDEAQQTAVRRVIVEGAVNGDDDGR